MKKCYTLTIEIYTRTKAINYWLTTDTPNNMHETQKEYVKWKHPDLRL